MLRIAPPASSATRSWSPSVPLATQVRPVQQKASQLSKAPAGSFQPALASPRSGAPGVGSCTATTPEHGAPRHPMQVWSGTATSSPSVPLMRALPLSHVPPMVQTMPQVARQRFGVAPPSQVCVAVRPAPPKVANSPQPFASQPSPIATSSSVPAGEGRPAPPPHRGHHSSAVIAQRAVVTTVPVRGASAPAPPPQMSWVISCGDSQRQQQQQQALSDIRAPVDKCCWDCDQNASFNEGPSASTVLEPDISGVIRPLSDLTTGTRDSSGCADPLLIAQGQRNSMAGSEAISSVSGIPSERGWLYDGGASGDRSPWHSERPSPGSGERATPGALSEAFASPADSQKTLSPSCQAGRESWGSGVASAGAGDLVVGVHAPPAEPASPSDSVATLSPPRDERKAAAPTAARSLSAGPSLRSVFGASDIVGYPLAPHPNRPVLRTRSAPRPAGSVRNSPPRRLTMDLLSASLPAGVAPVSIEQTAPKSPDEGRGGCTEPFIWGLSPMTRNDPDELLEALSSASPVREERITTSVASLRTETGTLSLSGSSPASSLATSSRTALADFPACPPASSAAGRAVERRRCCGALAKDLFPAAIDGNDGQLTKRAEVIGEVRRLCAASLEQAQVFLDTPAGSIGEIHGIIEPAPLPEATDALAQQAPEAPAEQAAEGPSPQASEAFAPQATDVLAVEASAPQSTEAAAVPAAEAKAAVAMQPPQLCPADIGEGLGSPSVASSCCTVPEPASEDMIAEEMALTGELVAVSAVVVEDSVAGIRSSPVAAEAHVVSRDDVGCYPCCIVGLGRLFGSGGRSSEVGSESRLPSLLGTVVISPTKKEPVMHVADSIDGLSGELVLAAVGE